MEEEEQEDKSFQVQVVMWADIKEKQPLSRFLFAYSAEYLERQLWKMKFSYKLSHINQKNIDFSGQESRVGKLCLSFLMTT